MSKRTNRLNSKAISTYLTIRARMLATLSETENKIDVVRPRAGKIKELRKKQYKSYANKKTIPKND